MTGAVSEQRLKSAIKRKILLEMSSTKYTLSTPARVRYNAMQFS